MRENGGKNEKLSYIHQMLEVQQMIVLCRQLSQNIRMQFVAKLI